jgi:hypothetical protein
MENTNVNSYNLSIRINSDGFSLSVVEDSGLLLSTKEVKASIFSLSSTDIEKLLKAETEINYKEIRFICETDNYLFVPTTLFVANEKSHYIGFQHKLHKNESILFNPIPAWDTVNVFSIPSNLRNAINSLFPDTVIEHQMSWLLSKKVNISQADSINIWIRTKLIDIIVLKNGKLHLLNSFTHQTPEDMTYHVLNVIEQLSLDVENSKVFLHNTEKGSAFEKLLSNYLQVQSDK